MRRCGRWEVEGVGRGGRVVGRDWGSLGICRETHIVGRGARRLLLLQSYKSEYGVESNVKGREVGG